MSRLYSTSPVSFPGGKEWQRAFQWMSSHSTEQRDCTTLAAGLRFVIARDELMNETVLALNSSATHGTHIICHCLIAPRLGCTKYKMSLSRKASNSLQALSKDNGNRISHDDQDSLVSAKGCLAG